MNSLPLFKDDNNVWVYKDDIIAKLKEIGACNCEYLFIHTDISFGFLNPSLKKKEYLEELYKCLCSLNVGTLIFPAFTYSFCNGEDFDVNNSKTSMGVLIEYIRKKPEAHRTLDPLLSLILVGENKTALDDALSMHSLGENSAFDKIHRLNNLKFLFFGAEFDEYFTYVHYVEKMLNVPYRFDKEFSGNIIDYKGNKYFDRHYIHTQCGKVKLKNYSEMKLDLIKENKLKIAKLGNKEVCCISEQDAYKAVHDRIINNINSFVEPFKEDDLTHEYTFGKNGERVTHC